VGEATAREGTHEVADPERLVVHADLVRDLLGVAGDRRLIEPFSSVSDNKFSRTRR